MNTSIIDTKPTILSSDVLIIGGGGAACRAAIEAHDQGASVQMIVKGNFGNSGCTLYVGTSAAVGPWAMDEDSNDISLKDLVSYGGFLANQDLARILIDETLDRVTEMADWGIEFLRDENGDIIPHKSAEHTYPRNFTFTSSRSSNHEYGSPPGIAMMDVLIEQVRAREISVLDNVALVDLTCIDGKVIGALGIDIQSGTYITLRSKATVLATGTYSQIFSPTTVSVGETGDGHSAAFTSGADLIDMECSQFVASTTSHLLGATFINARGEAFVENYGTNVSPDVAKEDLVYAIAKEMKAGGATKRGTLFLDLREPLRDEAVASNFLKHFRQRMKYDPVSAINKDIDPRTTLVETSPAAHTTIGGIRINSRCETNISGLYAAGSVAGGIYGLARPEGYTSMITLVFGRRAGVFASNYANHQNDQIVDTSLESELVRQSKSLVSNKSGSNPDHVKASVRNVLREFGWVIKDEAGLKKGLEEIRKISDANSTFMGSSGKEIVNSFEAKNMLLTAELLLLGSLDRKESRGAFFRDDYPSTDDDNYLCNIVYKSDNGTITLEHNVPDFKHVPPYI